MPFGTDKPLIAGEVSSLFILMEEKLSLYCENTSQLAGNVEQTYFGNNSD